jgi:hypothetical protein
MHGIPRVLQTRADFDLAVSLARSGEADRRAVAQHLRGLIEAAYHYVYDRDLAPTEPPDGAVPEFYVVDATEQDPVRRQLVRVVDPAGRLFALGFTPAEIESLITELEA